MAYEDRLKWLMIESNTLRKYEEKGYERGLEEGLKEKEDAVKKAEQEKEREIAKTLLLRGVDMESIAKATKLSIEEIKELIP